MNFVDRIAEAVANEPASEIESICRYEIANEMRRARRLFAEDEIEEIVDDVYRAEAIPVLEPEDGEVEVTEYELANIPEEDIVSVERDGEDVDGVIVGGRFAKLVVVPETRHMSSSRRIAKHVNSLAVMASTNDGVNLKSLYHPVANVTMPCPKCSSRNVTPVWFDNGSVIACCNECLAEFDADIDDVAHATLAERTVEDIDILPEYDVFGSVWLEEPGYGYEIYANGDMVDSGVADTFDDVQRRFDDYADAYEEIAEGAQVDFANGDGDVIEVIDGDDMTFASAKRASRARIARMLVDRKAFLDISAVEDEFEEGDGFDFEDSSLVVDSVDDDGIYARIIECSADGRISERMAKFSSSELRRYVSLQR